MISSAAIWCLWKLRNDICFQKTDRRSMDILLHQIVAIAQNWVILCQEEKRESMQMKIGVIKMLDGQIFWLQHQERSYRPGMWWKKFQQCDTSLVESQSGVPCRCKATVLAQLGFWFLALFVFAGQFCLGSGFLLPLCCGPVSGVNSVLLSISK